MTNLIPELSDLNSGYFPATMLSQLRDFQLLFPLLASITLCTVPKIVLYSNSIAKGTFEFKVGYIILYCHSISISSSYSCVQKQVCMKNTMEIKQRFGLFLNTTVFKQTCSLFFIHGCLVRANFFEIFLFAIFLI